MCNGTIIVLKMTLFNSSYIFKNSIIRKCAKKPKQKTKKYHIFHLEPVCQNAKNAIFSKTKQFRAMISIDNLVVHGLFKEPITGPIKSKTAEIGHLGSWCQNAKMRFSQKRSNLELWCLLTTYRKLRKLTWAFSKNPLLDPYNPRWLRSAILKSTWLHFFLPRVVQFG